MRISPARVAPVRVSPKRGFTVRQDLRGIVLRMISTNALSGFSPDVTFAPLTERVRGVSPAPTVNRDVGETQRRLDSVPEAPKGGLPRGSLLDLRV